MGEGSLVQETGELVVESMQVMELAPRALIQAINYKIKTIPWEKESSDRELKASHFMASMQESRGLKRNIGEFDMTLNTLT
jgi:hypothetical protein